MNINPKDSDALIKRWNRETISINNRLDYAFREAQDHAYALGLARGLEEAKAQPADPVRDAAPELLEALRKDAERYRWLAKDHGWLLLKHFPAVRPYVDASEVIDESIDAAIAKATGSAA